MYTYTQMWVGNNKRSLVYDYCSSPVLFYDGTYFYILHLFFTSTLFSLFTPVPCVPFSVSLLFDDRCFNKCQTLDEYVDKHR